MEDARKEGLKAGLRQLTSEQIRRVLDYPNEMVLDEDNYTDGKFCPLAVGLGLDQIVKQPTQEKVYAILALAGYKVNNTRGKKGEFYTTERARDLRTAAEEVLAERGE